MRSVFVMWAKSRDISVIALLDPVMIRIFLFRRIIIFYVADHFILK